MDGHDLKEIGLITFEFVDDPVLLEVHVFKTNKFTGHPVESDGKLVFFLLWLHVLVNQLLLFFCPRVRKLQNLRCFVLFCFFLTVTLNNLLFFKKNNNLFLYSLSLILILCLLYSVLKRKFTRKFVLTKKV